MATLKDYLTVTEAAERRGLTRQAILAVIKRGTLPATRVGNHWLIHQRDLEAFEPSPGGRPRKTERRRKNSG
jgi:excisionase family DNA binding protein